MLFYMFAVSGVGADDTGVQMRKVFRRRAKSALGHDKEVAVIPPEHSGTVRTLGEFARAFTKFNSRILDGETGRRFLISVDLPRLKQFCNIPTFTVSEFAEFIRRIIHDVGWKIEGEALEEPIR